MSELTKSRNNHLRRKNRIRATITGTAKRPRLTVTVSNLHVSAQLIDDTAGKTLASSTTVNNAKAKGTMTERAAWIGTDVATKAKKAKITSVVFDRNGRKYHGRIKALAEAARAEGLEF